jgi:DNA replication initiation complex subunit (GINS family)
MVEVRISYETLFDILRREKQKEELQDLPATFISDVASYLLEKEAILKKSKEEGNPFIAKEQESVRLQLHNIKKIIRELFERRENKIIRLAQDKVRTGQNPLNLLLEEQSLYDAIHAGVNDHRTVFVHALLAGKLVQDENRTLSFPSSNPTITNQTISHRHEEFTSIAKKESDLIASEPKPAPETSPLTIPDAPTKNVRILSPLPKFVGTELEVYGPFDQEDVTTLPSIIADLLIRKGRAEEVIE